MKSVFGFSLAWDGGSGVYLKMSEEHQGSPCGLCGNFNHIAGDDLTTARGKTAQLAPSSFSPFTRHPLMAITAIIHSAVILTNYSCSGTCLGLGRMTDGDWYFGFEWLKEAKFFSQIGRNMTYGLYLLW